MSTEKYRYIVRVSSLHGRADYVREVTVDGPQPEDAIRKALDAICGDGEDDLWQADEVTVKAERVR